MAIPLSVVIPCHNGARLLPATLAHIAAQRMPSELQWEVVLVDNASTDDSASMVESEFPQIHLICQDRHEGIAKSNNQAAALAQGNLLLFLNNDTSVRAGALTTLVRFLNQHPECSGVGPSLISPDGKLQGTARKSLGFRALLHRVLFLRWTRLFRSADREYRQVHLDLKQSAYVDQIVGAALLVRREQFMSIGGWDEAFEFHMDDVDLSSRLKRFGKMYYLSEAQVIHWGGIATNLDETYAYRCGECSRVYYLRKHCGALAARTYKLLVTADMPLRVFILALTWLVKRLFMNPERASRNYRKLTAAAQFLMRGLPHYWRA
jgi:GT2 family glycosyltransferase